MAGERRQGRRAGVPAEMVEFVALARHRHCVDDLAICRRAGLHVDYSERIGLREVRPQQQGVREFLRRRFHRKLRRRVKGRIRPHRQGSFLPDHEFGKQAQPEIWLQFQTLPRGGGYRQSHWPRRSSIKNRRRSSASTQPGRPVPTYCGRSRSRSCTPQLGGKRAYRVASGRTGVCAIAVIPLRARNTLHRPKGKSRIDQS